MKFTDIYGFVLEVSKEEYFSYPENVRQMLEVLRTFPYTESNN